MVSTLPPITVVDIIAITIGRTIITGLTTIIVTAMAVITDIEAPAGLNRGLKRI